MLLFSILYAIPIYREPTLNDASVAPTSEVRAESILRMLVINCSVRVLGGIYGVFLPQNADTTKNYKQSIETFLHIIAISIICDYVSFFLLSQG
jgi:hypothetical protein